MGYRSDVGLALTKYGMDRLLEKLDALDHESEVYRDVQEMISTPDNHSVQHDTGEQVFLWSYLKWYSSYPEIAFFESLTDELDPEEFLFLRIGESIDDTEEKGAFWDNPFNLRIERSIAMDG